MSDLQNDYLWLESWNPLENIESDGKYCNTIPYLIVSVVLLSLHCNKSLQPSFKKKEQVITMLPQIQIRIQIQIVLAPLHHLRDQIHRVAMSDCLVGANLISQRSDYLERLVKKEHKGRFAKMCNLRLRKKKAYSKISTHTLFIYFLNALSFHCWN